MAGQHRWTVSIVAGTSILGLTVTSVLAMVAHRIVEEFSRPHVILHEADFTWGMPSSSPEPSGLQQRSLLFKTADNTLLRGDFWAQPQPAPTIVLCHGYRISRSHLRSVAAREYLCGYNVFFFDFRGHGDSESVSTSGGNAEVCDLEAALFVADHQPETLPGKIIIHGFSMGASVALLTPPHPSVVAIIADSPYARSDDIMRRIVGYRLAQESERWIPLSRRLRYLFPAVAWATVASSAIVFRLRYGFGFVARPDTSFKRWKAQAKRAKAALQRHPIPILLIHGAGDMLIPIEHARQIAAEAKMYDVPLEMYLVEDVSVSHCGAYGYNPRQYNQVLQAFLERHLGSDFPEKHRKIDIND